MKPLTQVVGQAPGNVIALIQNGKVVDSAHFEDGEAGPASGEVVDEIPKLAAWIGTGKHEVDLAGHGEYLMEVRPGDGDERLVTAVSLEPAQEAVARETAIVAAMTALALLITALGTIAIVRFALRPLGRVASTAAEVATLRLDRDHHAITPRVPEQRHRSAHRGRPCRRHPEPIARSRRTRAGRRRGVGPPHAPVHHRCQPRTAHPAGRDSRLRRTDPPGQLAVLPETTEYSLARIEAEARRMNSLVSDLLLLARLDEGQDLDTTEVSTSPTSSSTPSTTPRCRRRRTAG